MFPFRRVRWIVVFFVVLSASSAVPVLAAENPSPPGAMVLAPTPDGFDPSRLPGTEDITEGVENAEREVKEREAWLQSPEAVQEREASRLAYSGLGAAEAKNLVSTAFAEELAQLNRDPVRVLSDAQLISSSEPTSATIKDEGDGMVLESSLPVRTENEQGQLRKVDVSLDATAAGFETENALVDVEIPDSVAEPVEVGDLGIAIKLAGADEDQSTHRFGDENAFATEVLPDTDMLVSPIATGVEIFNVLRSENSPETLRFQVQMPAGAELRAASDWGAEVVKDGTTLTTIPDPVAVDAEGADVPVEAPRSKEAEGPWKKVSRPMQWTLPRDPIGRRLEISAHPEICIGRPEPRFGPIRISGSKQSVIITARVITFRRYAKRQNCMDVGGGVAKVVMLEAPVGRRALFDGSTDPPTRRWPR